MYRTLLGKCTIKFLFILQQILATTSGTGDQDTSISMPTPYAELMSDTGILEDVDTAPPGPATKQSTGVQVMPSRRNARVQVTPIVAKLSKAKGRLIIMTLLALKMNQSVICCKYLAIQATPILCGAAIQCDLPQIPYR